MSRSDRQEDVRDEDLAFFRLTQEGGADDEEEDGEDEWVDREIEKLEAVQKVLLESM